MCINNSSVNQWREQFLTWTTLPVSFICYLLVLFMSLNNCFSLFICCNLFYCTCIYISTIIVCYIHMQTWSTLLVIGYIYGIILSIYLFMCLYACMYLFIENEYVFANMYLCIYDVCACMYVYPVTVHILTDKLK